ncbi:MAG: hypothetical protein M3Y59_09365, partial [Myxococcota bacterium]|nr:hypothetical protein [Myxococcota bacterium]
SLRELWKQFVSVRDARVRLVGFRLPNEELADIGRTVAERARKTDELEERYASLSPRYVPAAKPYPRGRPESLPFEEASTEPFRDSAGKFVGVQTSSGRVLLQWSTSTCQRVERLGARTFKASCGGTTLLTDRRGQPQLFDGESEFHRVETVGGHLVATRVIKRHPTVPGKPCFSAGMSEDQKGLHSSQGAAEDAVKGYYEHAAEAQRRRIEEAVASGQSSRGASYVCSESGKRAVEVVRFVLTPSLAVVSRTHGFEVQ